MQVIKVAEKAPEERHNSPRESRGIERTLYSRDFEFMVGGPWLAAVDAHEGSSPPVLRAQPCAAKASQDVITVLSMVW